MEVNIEGKTEKENMTLGKALLIIVAIIFVMGIFMWLLYLLKIEEGWVAFLFLWYWGAEKQLKFDELKNIVMGGALGLLMAYSLIKLPQPIGFIILGLGVVSAIMLMLFEKCKVLINGSTFLYLTVATAPALLAGANHLQFFKSLFIGTIFFGGIAISAKKLINRG